MNFRMIVENSIVFQCFSILKRSQRQKLIAVTAFQACMSFLDLLGVAIVGLLGALAISGVSTGSPGNRVSKALELLNIESFQLQAQVGILGSIAAILLLLRTILSIYFSKRIFKYLSHLSASLSAELIGKILSQPITSLRLKSSQELVYLSTIGVTSVSLNIIGSTVNLFTEVILLGVLTVGLVVLDPLTALSVLIVFLIVGYLLHRISSKKAKNLGQLDVTYSVNSNEEIVEIIESYREAVVRNRRQFYAKEIGNLRLRMADVLSEIAFLPSLNKYITEVAIILGALLISAIQFIMQDASHAFGTLAVFLAAGTRVAPAVLRIQQGQLTIRVNASSAAKTLELISDLRNVQPLEMTSDALVTDHKEFDPSISIKAVSYRYPKNDAYSLTNIDLHVKRGELIALTGPSGAGKTTLVDVLLGILSPEKGVVEISGMSPMKAINKWPGAIAYVPQDSKIISGSIKKNVCMGYPEDAVSDELVWDALRIAQLDEYVNNLEFGIDTEISDNGSNMSGGQRQRLGIARALITKPKMIILDEATSSLDGETEFRVSESIKSLRGNTTIIMIAHRLSSVKNSDKVFYIDLGEIKSSGSFDEVKREIPAFETQAKLMGL